MLRQEQEDIWFFIFYYNTSPKKRTVKKHDMMQMIE